jgi:hypothetical protein
MQDFQLTVLYRAEALRKGERGLSISSLAAKWKTLTVHEKEEYKLRGEKEAFSTGKSATTEVKATRGRKSTATKDSIPKSTRKAAKAQVTLSETKTTGKSTTTEVKATRGRKSTAAKDSIPKSTSKAAKAQKVTSTDASTSKPRTGYQRFMSEAMYVYKFVVHLSLSTLTNYTHAGNKRGPKDQRFQLKM